MSFLRGPARSQLQLLPQCVEDYVPENAPARFIDAFVEGLNFEQLGFVRAVPASTGRPPYHPADLLKLYIYGYLNRIRSSRRLEAEAMRNLELIWLLQGLRPDFKTVADFRRDNRQAFKPVLRQFNLLCRKMDLFGAELVAIDGSKFKAVNNSRNVHRPEELGEVVQQIDQNIEHYLQHMDQSDEQLQGVNPGPDAQALKEKIASLKGLVEELEESNKLPTHDRDSRLMKGPKGHLIGYNVQAAVDAKHDLIVCQEVTQAANDRGQLASMAQAAKEELSVERLQVLADKGYHEIDQLEACEKVGIETFVPEARTTSGQGKGGQEVFAKEQFKYDSGANVYHCPGQKQLSAHGINISKGKERIRYYNREACASCLLKTQCTKAEFRIIYRRTNEGVKERAAARLEKAGELLARRKEIVEHVFGTLRNWAHDTFYCLGLEMVRAEFTLSALAYNIRRTLSLRSIAQLLETLKNEAGEVRI